MEPSTAEELSVMVMIEGQGFLWTAEQGLDPKVVLTVDRFIWQKAYGFRRAAAQVGLSVDDLVQEGRLGALRAAELFDPLKPNKFLSYACNHVLGRMHSALSAREVYVTFRERNRLRKAGESPSISSLDAQVPEGRAFKSEQGPEEAEACEDRDQVRAALARIPERDRLVLQMLFGIDTEEKTLAEVGEFLGLTKQRAHQLQHRAMLRLRLALGAKDHR